MNYFGSVDNESEDTELGLADEQQRQQVQLLCLNLTWGLAADRRLCGSFVNACLENGTNILQPVDGNVTWGLEWVYVMG
mgnify:CR=1 FL=1